MLNKSVLTQQTLWLEVRCNTIVPHFSILMTERRKQRVIFRPITAETSDPRSVIEHEHGIAEV